MSSTTTTARISSDLIPVSFYENILTIQVIGYEDIENLRNKSLFFDGRTFTFTGWDSDAKEAYFKPSRLVAKIIPTPASPELYDALLNIATAGEHFGVQWDAATMSNVARNAISNL